MMSKMSPASSILPRRQAVETDKALGPDFRPGPYDVICSRGKVAYNHSGNRHFRTILETYLEDYKKCVLKLDKSVAVIAIVDDIRKLSPNGGFIKFCKDKKCYVEVGDKRAKEKVGHALRELMVSNGKGGQPSTWKNVTKKVTTKKKMGDEEELAAPEKAAKDVGSSQARASSAIDGVVGDPVAC